MDIFFCKVDKVLTCFGYKRRDMSYWKIDRGVYKLIDFQKSSYERKNYFINICIHPVGLPKLQPDNLLIVDRPKEYECILRMRIDKILKKKNISFSDAFIFSCDDQMIDNVIKVLPIIDDWLNYYGDIKNISSLKEDEVFEMLTVVPVLWEKAFFMLKFYCFTILLDKEEAKYYYSMYKSVCIDNFNFNKIDSYLVSLLGEV